MINILMSRSGALVSDYAIDYTKKYFKENMKVVIIGYSHFGNLSKEKYDEYYGVNSEYQEKMRAIFKVFNITDVTWVSYFDNDISKIKELIKSADILYYPGGAPDLMMDRIIEKGLLEDLKAFDKIVVGSSAGAMVQLNIYHISPDYDYHKFSENMGLGYIDNFFIEVHYRRRTKQKSSMRLIRRKYKKPIYIIPDDGMLIVDNGSVISLNSAKKLYNEKGLVK